MKTIKKISLISVLIILLGCVNIARADVCFLPAGGCDMVPYEEYKCEGKDCPSNCDNSKGYYTREQIEKMNEENQLHSFDLCYWKESNGCYYRVCNELELSCDASYDLTTPKEGEGWACDDCDDADGKHYKCTAKQCAQNSSVSCVADECKTCVDKGYSGDNVCQEPQDVAAHCPEGYVSDEPAGGCYSTQDMLCGSGKCYKATKTPECGEGKRLAKANGVCSCVNEDRWFVMQDDLNVASCLTVESLEGDGISFETTKDGSNYLKFIIGKSFKINYSKNNTVADNNSIPIVYILGHAFENQTEFTIDDDFLNKVFPNGVENYQWYMNTDGVDESNYFTFDDTGDCEAEGICPYVREHNYARERSYDRSNGHFPNRYNMAISLFADLESYELTEDCMTVYNGEYDEEVNCVTDYVNIIDYKASKDGSMGIGVYDGFGFFDNYRITVTINKKDDSNSETASILVKDARVNDWGEFGPNNGKFSADMINALKSGTAELTIVIENTKNPNMREEYLYYTEYSDLYNGHQSFTPYIGYWKRVNNDSSYIKPYKLARASKGSCPTEPYIFYTENRSGWRNNGQYDPYSQYLTISVPVFDDFAVEIAEWENKYGPMNKRQLNYIPTRIYIILPKEIQDYMTINPSFMYRVGSVSYYDYVEKYYKK